MAISRTLSYAVMVSVILAGIVAFAVPSAEAKYASLVIDADSGNILHAVNQDTRNYPASLTKMMTLYMVFKAIDDGKINLSTRWRISARAARQPASKLGLRRGETITVREAIFILITKSANDVAAMIAESLGGTERKFALSMTATARNLGMSRTTFRNASGLPHRGQLSTASDMATLAKRLMSDYPHYYRYFSTKSYVFKGKRYKNHNALLGSYNGVDGIKTGYTRASGYNLVASAKRNGRRLIGVVFGGKSSRSRNAHMKRLLDKGFNAVGAASMAQLPPSKPSSRASKASKALASRKKTPRTSASLSPGWGVQVGVYGRHGPALEMARNAVSMAGQYLAEGIIRILPLKRYRKKPLYRARVLGLNKKAAYRACRILKKRKYGCMELKLKPSERIELAWIPE